MTLLQILIIAAIQGVTELFPVSSVAHAVLTPRVFDWPLDPAFIREHFLPFVVMLHLGTAIALLIYFGKDWLAFARGLLGGDSAARRTARRELLLIVLGTIPAALIGLVFEKRFAALFPSATSAGFFLLVNGVILFAGEKLKGRGKRELADLGLGAALLIGLAQSLALVPGFSRSGASMVAGFWAGLSHGASARFSMLLATPIIAGASLIEVPKLLHAPAGTLGGAVFGGVVAGIVAFASVTVLMMWFRRREVDAMQPFAVYCWIVGALVLMFL